MKKGTIITLIIILSILSLFLINLLISLITNDGTPNWGFSINSQFQVQKEQEVEIASLNKILFNTSSSDVRIHKTDSKTIRILQSAPNTLKEDDFFTTSISNGILSIQEHVKPHFYFFYFGPTHYQYDIYVPQEYIGAFSSMSSSGNVTICDSFSLENISIKTSSGDIKLLGNLSLSDSLLVESTSGNIQSQGTLVSQKLDFKTTSGDIDIQNDTTITSDITLQAVSGNIKSRNTITCSSSKISSTSGDINLTNLQTKASSNFTSVSGNIRLNTFSSFGTMNTTSGDITISNYLLLGDTNISSTSGNVRLILDKNSNCDIYDNSISGSISIPNEVRRMGTEPYHTLNIKTTSGDIHVK